MIKGIEVICLWAEDVPEAAHFYRDVLGMELDVHHVAGRPHFRIGDTFLTILKGTPRPPEDPQPARFPLFAFKVDDLDAALARLKAHNVEMPWGIEGYDDSRWVMFYDPAGNLIELT